MATEKYGPHKSSLNIDANVLALLIYVGAYFLGMLSNGWLAFALPLILFFVEKTSRFVRFHAMQSMVLQVVSFVLGIVVSIVSGGVALTSILAGDVAGLLALLPIFLILSLIGLVIFIFTIIAAVKSYKYEAYEIPVVGGLAQKLLAKFENKNQTPGQQ